MTGLLLFALVSMLFRISCRHLSPKNPSRLLLWSVTIFTWNSNNIHLLTLDNLHTNTCACIPELGQKCWLDVPDSLPTQIQKRESGDETSHVHISFIVEKKIFKKWGPRAPRCPHATASMITREHNTLPTLRLIIITNRRE